MYAFDQGAIVAADTTFASNAAKLYGGALSAYASSIDTTDCLFGESAGGATKSDGAAITDRRPRLTTANNVANSTGGAISGYADSTVTTTGCTYKNNRAQ